MSSRSRSRAIQQCDVDEAQERVSKSEEKMWRITGDQEDLREQIDRCEEDIECFSEQVVRRRYRNREERDRLDDKYNHARRHKAHLEEQYERVRGRLSSARATLDRHRDEYEELDRRYDEQMLRRSDRERDQWESEQWRSHRHRRPSHGPETGSRSRTHHFETEERYPPHHSRSSRHHSPPPSPSHSTTPTPSSRMPTPQTVASWRRYVDDCFKNCAGIKEFPHPPIPGRRDDPTTWTENLKALFSGIQGLDLKNEFFKWHPDKFSPCDASKKEQFQGYAREVFVVLTAMVQERKR